MGLAAFMSQLGTDTRSSVPSGTSGGGSGGGIGGAPAMVTQLLRCAQLRFYAATGQAKHTPTDAAVRAAITSAPSPRLVLGVLPLAVFIWGLLPFVLQYNKLN